MKKTLKVGSLEIFCGTIDDLKKKVDDYKNKKCNIEDILNYYKNLACFEIKTDKVSIDGGLDYQRDYFIKNDDIERFLKEVDNSGEKGKVKYCYSYNLDDETLQNNFKEDIEELIKIKDYWKEVSFYELNDKIERKYCYKNDKINGFTRFWEYRENDDLKTETLDKIRKVVDLFEKEYNVKMKKSISQREIYLKTLNTETSDRPLYIRSNDLIGNIHNCQTNGRVYDILINAILQILEKDGKISIKPVPEIENDTITKELIAKIA